ncbi:MAG: hypothetical protein ACRD0U_13950 [Acidimicrobiales bacterium]
MSAVLLGLAIRASLVACNGDDSPTTTTAADLYDSHAIFAQMYFNSARETALAVRQGEAVDPELDHGAVRTAEEAYDEAVSLNAGVATEERILNPATGVMPDPTTMTDAQLRRLAELARGDCPPPGCETFGREVERLLLRAP